MRRTLTALLQRVALFALLGWMLAEGRHDAPVLAAVFVCAAAGVSLVLQPTTRARWHPTRLPRLVFYVLRQSLLGGWDVAQRALTPSLPIAPGFVRLDLALPNGFPVVLFAWIVSLTPGTASVVLEGTSLLVHVLDSGHPVRNQLRELEQHVAALLERADE